ncbi:MAG: YkgJ family cysteine cluster protein [Sphaerochaetaceae bacterium]
MNSERDEICHCLGSTFIGESLKQLSQLYDQIEEETSAFCEKYQIHCQDGCGTCCEHFMPDITVLEARMVAAYLVLVKKDLLLIDKVQNSDQPFCPLYEGNNPHHCTVYAARPLVCRLFGACASRNKNGIAEFRRCRFNEGETMPEHLIFSPEVRGMDDYGIQLRSLETGTDQVADLDEAVSNSLGEVRMICSFIDNDDNNDDDTLTPNPLAS